MSAPERLRYCFGVVAASLLAATSADAASCLRVLQPLPQGRIVQSTFFGAAPCRDVHGKSFAYVRATGAVRTTRDLAIGEIVPAFAGYGAAAVAPGQSLTLLVQRGPVRVARRVEALQSARPGERLFVRSEDGKVLSVRYVPELP